MNNGRGSGAALLFPLFANLLLASALQVGSAPATTDAASSLDELEISNNGVDLQLLTSRAALIFAGTVTKVELGDNKWPANTSASGIRIGFHVDEGIRGVDTGQELTIQEWRGLWIGNRGQRYRVGDRVLVFYHKPGALGFTSPVSGDVGLFPIKAGELVHLNTSQRRALLRSSRLQVKLTDAAIAKGVVPYEQVAKIVRQLAATR